MTSDSDRPRNYLRDLGQIFVDLAREAKRVRDNSGDGEDRSYAVGRLMAFHEVISVMQQQAQAFEMSLEEINLADVDPQRDLV